MLPRTASLGGWKPLNRTDVCPMIETQLWIPVVLPGPYPKLQSEAARSPTPPLPALVPHDPLLKLPCLNRHWGCIPGKGVCYAEGNITSRLCINQRLTVRHPSTKFHSDPLHHFDNQNCSPTLRKCLPGSHASYTELINPNSAPAYLCLELCIAA